MSFTTGTKTNDLKKGQLVELRNGWRAELADNMRGNTRMAKVFGHYTEMGSVYAHDIIAYQLENEGIWIPVVHTKAQLKLKEQVNRAMGI